MGKIEKKIQRVKDKIDLTCDKCGKIMRQGGKYEKDFGERYYQFCSLECMHSFDPEKDDEK